MRDARPSNNTPAALGANEYRIVGKLLRPGSYTLNPDKASLVRDALAAAGLDSPDVFVTLARREGSKPAETVILNAQWRMLQSISSLGDVELRGGDELIVTEKEYPDVPPSTPQTQPTTTQSAPSPAPSTTQAALDEDRQHVFSILGFVDQAGMYQLGTYKGRPTSLKIGIRMAGVKKDPERPRFVYLIRPNAAATTKRDIVVEGAPIADVLEGFVDDVELKGGDLIWIADHAGPLDDRPSTRPAATTRAASLGGKFSRGRVGTSGTRPNIPSME